MASTFTDSEPDSATPSTREPQDANVRRASARAETTLTVNPRRIAIVLTAVVIGLASLSSAGRVLMSFFDPEVYHGLQEVAWRFDLDHESNIPTLYSALALFSAAVLLACITRATRRTGGRDVWHWAVLSAAFFYLSIDESAYLHEILIVPLRRRLDAHGIFFFAWVIPGFVAVSLFGLAYLGFLWRLRTRTRWLFITAGAIFVGGALGLELVGGALAEAHGLQAAGYAVVMTAEESCEMLGVVLFIYALLDYLRATFGPWRIAFAPSGAGQQIG